MTARQAQKDQLFQLLDSAKQLRSSGEALQALPIFRSLRENKAFTHQAYAWQQYAICMVEIGQTDQAYTELKSLVKDYSAKTLIRAHNLRLAAQVGIALADYDNAGKYLAEAKGIFDEHGEFYYVGIIKQLEGALATQQQRIEEAIQLISEGTRMAEVHRIPANGSDFSSRAQASLVATMG